MAKTDYTLGVRLLPRGLVGWLAYAAALSLAFSTSLLFATIALRLF